MCKISTECKHPVEEICHRLIVVANVLGVIGCVKTREASPSEGQENGKPAQTLAGHSARRRSWLVTKDARFLSHQDVAAVHNDAARRDEPNGFGQSFALRCENTLL